MSDCWAKCLDGFRYLEIGSDHSLSADLISRNLQNSDSAAPQIAEESLLFFWFSLENQINKRNIFHFWPGSFPVSKPGSVLGLKGEKPFFWNSISCLRASFCLSVRTILSDLTSWRCPISARRSLEFNNPAAWACETNASQSKRKTWIMLVLLRERYLWDETFMTMIDVWLWRTPLTPLQPRLELF